LLKRSSGSCGIKDVVLMEIGGVYRKKELYLIKEKRLINSAFSLL
jgi:hypothetical protein